MKQKSLLGILFFFIFPISARAHCPLCTIGAAAAAGGAAYLGVNPAIIGLFIGAFAVSTGWWASRWIKKTYIPHQKEVIILIAFLFTVIPIIPVIGSESFPLYISWVGDYGRTFAISSSWITSIFGGLIVSITPQVSKKISSLRKGKIFPYQGVLLTLISLVVIGAIMQVVL